MLSILGKPGRLCDSPSRRDLLTVGGLGLLGLSLPDVLHREAKARELPTPKRPPTGSGNGRADSVILLYLQGSPSHIDTWDPKPNAPVEFRGEFKPAATNVSGVYLSETLPLLAKQADKFALVRSISVKPRGLANHGASIYMIMTAHDPTNFSPTGLAVPPSREDLPSMGSIALRYRPVDAGMLGYVALCGPIIEGGTPGVGMFAGLLGAMHDPFQMYQDPTKPLNLEAFSLPSDVTLGRMRGRMDLRGALATRRQLGPADFDKFYGKALSLVERATAARAFRLDDEPPKLRERYGQSKFGQSCLLARRLIEAGTRFVQVSWPAGSDFEPVPGPDGSWDTHRNNFPMLRNWRHPVFDQTVSALLEDLWVRGLLAKTLVLAIGEFGRSPKIGSPTTNNVGPGGRDHWPSCYTCLMAGGGVRGGQVYGESDRYAAFPKINPVHPYDVTATVFHALGIDHATEYRDTLDRPRRLTEHGGPIVGLF